MCVCGGGGALNGTCEGAGAPCCATSPTGAARLNGAVQRPGCGPGGACCDGGGKGQQGLGQQFGAPSLPLVTAAAAALTHCCVQGPQVSAAPPPPPHPTPCFARSARSAPTRLPGLQSPILRCSCPWRLTSSGCSAWHLSWQQSSAAAAAAAAPPAPAAAAPAAAARQRCKRSRPTSTGASASVSPAAATCRQEVRLRCLLGKEGMKDV